MRCGGQHSMLTRMSNFFRTLCVPKIILNRLNLVCNPRLESLGGSHVTPLTVLISHFSYVS